MLANSADLEGGAWMLGGLTQEITFENVRFENTSATLRGFKLFSNNFYDSLGGCISNSAAHLTLYNVTFKVRKNSFTHVLLIQELLGI